MQCACLSDAVRLPSECISLRRFRVREKTGFRDLLKSMLLLNRKELEDVFYIQMERLYDSYPIVYQFHRLYERIKKVSAKMSAAQARAAHRFRNCFKTMKNLEKCSTF